MAASIYATPPPDLSSEDTALSDVSNTSSTTTTNNATTAAAVTATTPPTSSIAAVVSSTSSSSSSSSSSLLNQATTTQQHHPYQHYHTNSKPPAMTNTCELKLAPSPKLSTSKTKRTIADVFKDKATSAIHHNSSSSFAHGGSSIHSASNAVADDDASASIEHQHNNNTAAMAAVAAAANAAMQLQLLEALNDAAKKRRKQNNPTRMEDDEKNGNDDDDDDHLHGVRAIKCEQVSPGRGSGSNNPAVDYEDKLSKMFLPKSMEHLKETFELLHQQQQQNQIENISKSHKSNEAESQHRQHDVDMVEQRQHQQEQYRRQAEEEAAAYNNNPYQTFCKECGENFENEFKLSLHMLQEHNEGQRGSEQTIGEMSPMDILTSVKVKLERPDCGSPPSGQNSNQGNTNDQQNAHLGANGKEHQQLWMTQPQMPPMGFPFPPEAAAAAALQAGGYLPLLAVPGFPGVDGLNRPPLRIFNPEAFCELCNKEFCNKYFLKTHKANKHGIYDPVGDTAGSASQQSNTMNAMNQMFQLQMQQQQQHLQQQHQMKIELAAQQQQQQQQQQHQPHPKMLNDNPRKDRDDKSSSSLHPQQGPSPVYCDICSKRFTNVFAMRRHRAKAHDQNANAPNSQRNSPNTSQSSTEASAPTDLQATKQFQMPDGFRQDFALEQEEVSFTPQPRKLSPQSQQQAREANFAHDKLKRLGVINPDAFCELCCKEYCNKYFLRTHKWKRHGIFMPPEDSENFQKMPNWPFMNMPGMPVNLMMAQRMMATAENNSDEMDPHHQQQPSKRIKFEAPDAEEEVMVKESANDENQENRSENNQNLSIPSTPEPHKLHPDAPTGVTSAEAAMGLQNLQKLQSMIQQLNDLNGKRPAPCHLCGREMENQYALQAHIMSEHNGGLEGMPPLNFPPQLMLQQQTLLKQSPNGSPGSLMPVMGGMAGMGGELRCTPCDREFSNLPEFQKHITEVHLLPNTSKGSPLREGFVTPERKVNASMVPAARQPYTITPTSSYCEICNKELCNKYFMKTHMQRMHGIEIENGAQIGGVVCNICNKELCSKYFLRVHKHNTHGIIEEGSPLPQPRTNGLKLETESVQQQPPPPPPSAAPATATESENLNRNLNVSPFGSGGSGSDVKTESSAYSTTYTESCPICNRRFRSPKWLRSHLLHDHGPSGVDKMREMEQHYSSQSKPSSPTLKIPNGSSSGGGGGSISNNATPTSNVPSPAQLAQALQNLNAQQLLQNMPKNQMTATPSYNNAEPNLQSPRIKEYQCSQCSFTTPYYAFLFIHERTHSIMNGEEQHHGSEEKVKEIDLEEEDEEEEQRIETNEGMDVDMQKELQRREIMEDSHDVDRAAADSEMNQPTNLSMRTPSPRPSNIKEEVMEENSPSPLLDLSRENSISADKNNTISNETPKHFQSVACSPIFNMQQHHHQLLQDVAEQFGKTASYAVPRERAANDSPPPQMQAFAIDTEQTDEFNRFVPAIIYLPVKERITGSMKLSFNLTPV